MDEREYLIPLPGDALLRVRYQKDRGHILRFTVSLKLTSVASRRRLRATTRRTDLSIGTT
jgi:hypothetical protein